MRDTIRISTVIPTYNREHTIARAIDSVLAQEYKPAEIIVVDDGSTDNTQKTIQAYGDDVRYVYQQNRGVSAARNRGVSEANGEWIAFLDSDDYWSPNYLGMMASAIAETDGQASLYFTNTMRSQAHGGISHWNLCNFQIPGIIYLKNDACEWAFLPRQPMMFQSSIIRRKTYWKVGGLPENLLTREDTYLFFKLALQYPACAVSGVGAIMKSDGTQRLTSVYDGENIVYLQSTIMLYKLLLASEEIVTTIHRKLLKNSLSHGYFVMGRYYWRNNDFMEALINLVVAAWVSPNQFARRVVDKMMNNSPIVCCKSNTPDDINKYERKN